MKTKHVLLNGQPKAGNHLLDSLANRLGGRYALNRYAQFADFRCEHKRVAWWRGHISWSLQAENDIRTNLVDGVMIYIVRDLRDVVTSLYRGVSEGYRHLTLRHKMIEVEKLNREEAIEAIINTDVRFSDRFLIEALDLESYENDWLSWTKVDYCYTTKFENLIGKEGGGTKKKQEQEIKNIVNHIGVELLDWSLEDLLRHLYNERSSHFIAGGKIGAWKKYFTKKNVMSFKKKAGDLLIKLGYEKDNNWTL